MAAFVSSFKPRQIESSAPFFRFLFEYRVWEIYLEDYDSLYCENWSFQIMQLMAGQNNI